MSTRWTATLQNALIAAFILGLSMTGASCRSAPARVESASRDALEKRVLEYWRMRQRKDLSAMYEFYAPSYRRRHPKEEFLRKVRLVRFDIVDYRVTRVSLSAERADVTVEYRIPPPPKVQSAVREPLATEVTATWIKERYGRWYKETEKLLLPGPDGKPMELED